MGNIEYSPSIRLLNSGRGGLLKQNTVLSVAYLFPHREQNISGRVQVVPPTQFSTVETLVWMWKSLTIIHIVIVTVPFSAWEPFSWLRHWSLAGCAKNKLKNKLKKPGCTAFRDDFYWTWWVVLGDVVSSTVNDNVPSLIKEMRSSLGELMTSVVWETFWIAHQKALEA